MNNQIFSNSFNFNHFHFKLSHDTDSRKGSPYHYIAFLCKGQATIVHDNGSLELSAGDCFYIPRNLSYRSSWQGNPEIDFLSFGFTCFPNPTNSSYPLQKIGLPDSYEIIKSIDVNQNYSCENIGVFYTVLARFLKCMNKEVSGRHELILSEAAEYMQNHLQCKISDVAAYCHISESGLYKIFQEQRKMTPTDLRQKLQVERALAILCSTDLKIEEVAEQCGFCSVIYFRKVFKKVTGKLPSQVRKAAAP